MKLIFSKRHSGLIKPIAILIGLSFSAAALCEPYTPTSDDEVLETLPSGLVSGQSRLAKLRQQLQAQTKKPDAAAALARRYLQLANSSGDPRYWGYAQAALGPWWEQSSPPREIQYLRARLQEKQHQYEAAIADYKAILARQPRHLQARLDLSNLYRVQGQYELSLSICAPLQQIAGSRLLNVCRNPVLAVTGKAEQAYASLQEMARWARLSAPAIQVSNQILMAEISAALGEVEQAKTDFRAALALAPQDIYLRRAYADFLLDQKQPQQALDLLQDSVQDNGALLRAAIAAEKMNQQPNDFIDELQRRFEEIRRRGDQPHGRYEARFELEVKHNPDKALALATANWKRQKETRDTRNLLAAALAAKQPGAAQAAIIFVRENQTEDIPLQRLIAAIEALK